MATATELGATISALEAILGSGSLSGTVDGIQATFADTKSLISRINYFREQLQRVNGSPSKRPRASNINLGGF